MSKKVTFGDVHRLLTGLGFVKKTGVIETPLRVKFVAFEHEPSDTLLVFRAHRLNEKIDAMNLASVRFMLDARGFIERDDFDDALRDAAANGRTRTSSKRK
jgi:hypothetical protein